MHLFSLFYIFMINQELLLIKMLLFQLKYQIMSSIPHHIKLSLTSWYLVRVVLLFCKLLACKKVDAANTISEHFFKNHTVTNQAIIFIEGEIMT